MAGPAATLKSPDTGERALAIADAGELRSKSAAADERSKRVKQRSVAEP